MQMTKVEEKLVSCLVLILEEDPMTQGDVTCPQSHSQLVAQAGLEPTSLHARSYQVSCITDTAGVLPGHVTLQD